MDHKKRNINATVVDFLLPDGPTSVVVKSNGHFNFNLRNMANFGRAG